MLGGCWGGGAQWPDNEIRTTDYERAHHNSIAKLSPHDSAMQQFRYVRTIASALVQRYPAVLRLAVALYVAPVPIPPPVQGATASRNQ